MPRKVSQPGIYIEELSSGVRTIQGVPTSIAVFIGPALRGFANRPQRVMSFAAFERAFGGLSAGLETGYAVRQFFMNGGSDAWVVRIAKDAGLAQIERALRALASLKDFNLLVLPGVTDSAILAAATAVCEARRAFLIADAPVTGATDPDPVGAMVHAMQGTTLPRSRNGAVYFPWLRIPDPLAAGALRLAPPSGAVAGLFARTDSMRGVWKAPAGADATLTGVQDPGCALTDAHNAVLNPLAVNCLRKFPNYGTVCWGSRTLAGADANASEWKYVPVRRLALYIEESLYRGTKWTVFEHNDEPLWSQLRLNIGAFMHGLFLKGAFQGATSKEAYFVKCDRETTTQADISRGIVNILVGFAPLKPAEFIILKIQQSAGQPAH
jgi:phage tail sheath protein FI